MVITTRVTRELKSPAMGTVLRILYTLMFAAIAERHGVQGWALKATSSCGTVSWWGIICTLIATLRCITQMYQWSRMGIYTSTWRKQGGGNCQL